MVKRSRTRSRKSRNPRKRKFPGLAGFGSRKRGKSNRNPSFRSSSYKPSFKGVTKVVPDGPTLAFKTYKVAKHNASLESKILDALCRPLSLVQEEVKAYQLTRGAASYHFYNVGDLVDLRDLAKNASPVTSSGVADMMTKVLYRNLSCKYENITASVGCQYEAYWVMSRHGEESYPYGEMYNSANGMQTGTQDQWASSNVCNFSISSNVNVAGTTVNYGSSTSTMYNPFAFRTFVSNFKVVKSSKGYIEPGKSVTFDLTMKPCSFNATDLSFSNTPCNILKKYYLGLILKFTGDLSYTEDSNHYVAEHGVHLQSRILNSQILKQLQPSTQNLPFTGYKRSGFDPAVVSGSHALVINDEMDDVAYCKALDTNAATE